MPWRPEARVQLVDAPAQPLLPPGLLRDLAELDAAPRRVLVLERVAGLTTAQVGGVLGLGVSQVHQLALGARSALADRNPQRADDAALDRELAQAVGSLPSAAAAPGEDIAHGRMLVRRRRLRQGLVAAATLVAVALGAAQVTRVVDEPAVAPPRAPAAPSFSPTPEGRPAGCDTSQPSCQGRVLRDWRSQMAEVTSVHLDPKRTYFTGYAYSYTDLYETPEFWKGRPGALGLDMFRMSQGATEVYIQIATDRESAVRCGRVTRQRCVSTRFMDGNRFALTETTSPAEGIEVQYRPTGQQVITVVARNVAGGRPLDLDRADLLALVQDKRLRLPRL
jgi:hypothetical protein